MYFLILEDLDAFMCSIFIFLDLHYYITVFIKFYTWLRVRGSALRLAKAFYMFTVVC